MKKLILNLKNFFKENKLIMKLKKLKLRVDESRSNTLEPVFEDM